MKKLENILAENMRRFGTKNLNEQEEQDFLNVYLEDFKKQGWTLESGVAKGVGGMTDGRSTNTLTKNDMQIIFTSNALTGIKVSVKIFPSDMGSDNLQNKDLANAFKAYNHKTPPDIIKLPRPHESGEFKFWYATVNYSTVGKTKESTPFYKYYADIIKLSQISDKFSAVNNMNVKDQLKTAGSALKTGFGQLAGKAKAAIAKTNATPE
jgi:hypothetical protein